MLKYLNFTTREGQHKLIMVRTFIHSHNVLTVKDYDGNVTQYHTIGRVRVATERAEVTR